MTERQDKEHIHSGTFGSFVKYWDRRTEQSRCVVVFKGDDINFFCHLSVFHQKHPLTQHKSCSGRIGRFHQFAQDFTLGGTQLSGTVQTQKQKHRSTGLQVQEKGRWQVTQKHRTTNKMHTWSQCYSILRIILLIYNYIVNI